MCKQLIEYRDQTGETLTEVRTAVPRVGEWVELLVTTDNYPIDPKYGIGGSTAMEAIEAAYDHVYGVVTHVLRRVNDDVIVIIDKRPSFPSSAG